MINIDEMAKLIEAEESQEQKPENQPAASAQELTEERAAEMIETAVNAANEKTAQTLQGLTETIAALTAQLETLKGKEKEDNGN